MGGCDADDDMNDQFVEDDVAPLPNDVIRTVEDGQEVISYRAILPNGITLNGITLNGITLNGPDFTDWLLNELPDIVNLQVNEEGKLTIQRPNESTKIAKADDKIGVRFKLDGETYRLKITEFENGEDLQFMRVRYRHLDDDVLLDACTDSDGNPLKAVIVPGAYDSVTGDRVSNTSKTIWACRGTSIAKASEMGYEADDPHHEALTRVFRADYCYDGTPHTISGTPVDIISDDAKHVSESDWPIEAVWGQHGLLCLDSPRKTNWDRYNIGCLDENDQPYQPPPCDDGLHTEAYWLSHPDMLLVSRAIPSDPPA